ncbi:type III secretion system inner rod subunit SctI [Pandoraea sputorum]|uniref:type III secretion system inner rod subunit SctI n=1 Tax=Pandoraea sputorum TaxID=93222 RepID=UPI00123F0EAC|nr:type III secretion system inner rod subunit SctI [Pandoraea sputorum]VVE55827.1 hypothetical protein PSP20601_05015 [Pandoraea sputorum]
MIIESVLRSLGAAATTVSPAAGVPALSLQQRFTELLNNPLAASPPAAADASAATLSAGVAAADARLGPAAALNMQRSLIDVGLTTELTSKVVGSLSGTINKLLSQP